MSKIGFVGILAISVLAALFLSSPVTSEDFGYIHCDFDPYVINGFACDDWNIWYAPEGIVTQEMRDYYEGSLGLEYITPQQWPETFTVTGAPSGTYSGN